MLQTHTQNMSYLLLFHYHNGCTNAPRCYVIRTCTLPVWFLLRDLEADLGSTQPPCHFHCGESYQGMRVTTHHRLVLTLRMNGAIPLPLYTYSCGIPVSNSDLEITSSGTRPTRIVYPSDRPDLLSRIWHCRVQERLCFHIKIWYRLLLCGWYGTVWHTVRYNVAYRTVQCGIPYGTMWHTVRYGVAYRTVQHALPYGRVRHTVR
jgi:hypothetical protein